MAKIETTFIRPQEVFTPDTGKAKVVYDGYQNNPHEIVLQENLDGDVEDVINDTFVANADGNVAFTDSDNVSHELLTAQGLGKAQVIATTWSALKALRDGGNLVAGSLYRITDYVTTTTQENTQSAGHQFDIVLLALSANKLAEEGWAMMHDNIYDVTFNDAVVKCYLYQGSGEGLINIVDCSTLLGMEDAVLGEDIVVNESNKTAQTNDMLSSNLVDEGLKYNYFQNSNLSAWKVWYCLDNDIDRFAWADDRNYLIEINDRDNIKFYRNAGEDIVESGLYAWIGFFDDSDIYIYTKVETPNTGDKVYDDVGDETGNNVKLVSNDGRGVIYRLIDEFNNDIKYDFKNIQFKRPITDGQYDANGTETWCYTLNVWYNNMCQDASIVGNTMPNDEGFIIGVYDNIFGYVTAYDLAIDGVDTFAFALGNNVILSYDDGGYFGIYSNTIGNDSFNNTIGNDSFNNTIGNNFIDNTIGNNFIDNTIGNNFYSNTIGTYFNSNTIGNNFTDNTIGNNFYSNMIGNDFYSNMIEDIFNSNMIGNKFYKKNISTALSYANYGNNGVELATKDDLN